MDKTLNAAAHSLATWVLNLPYNTDKNAATFIHVKHGVDALQLCVTVSASAHEPRRQGLEKVRAVATAFEAAAGHGVRVLLGDEPCVDAHGAGRRAALLLSAATCLLESWKSAEALASAGVPLVDARQTLVSL